MVSGVKQVMVSATCETSLKNARFPKASRKENIPKQRQNESAAVAVRRQDLLEEHKIESDF